MELMNCYPDFHLGKEGPGVAAGNAWAPGKPRISVVFAVLPNEAVADSVLVGNLGVYVVCV